MRYFAFFLAKASKYGIYFLLTALNLRAKFLLQIADLHYREFQVEWINEYI